MAINYAHNAFAENRFKQTHMMKNRPDGWLIMDSWNNKVFPMDIFQVDTLRQDTERLAAEFHRLYGGNNRDLFLPWHWVVEIINGKPFVMQTRPPLYKSNIPGYPNRFTIMIIGDSNIDIYPALFYKQMAHMIINPWKYIPSVRVPNSKEDFIFWTGKNFKVDYLLNEMN